MNLLFATLCIENIYNNDLRITYRNMAQHNYYKIKMQIKITVFYLLIDTSANIVQTLKLHLVFQKVTVPLLLTIILHFIPCADTIFLRL